MIRVFTSKSQILGKIGEDVAVKFLIQQGFSIVDRNVSSMFGEIDIVAQKGRVMHFFEVKSGRAGSSITPAENLHAAKRSKFMNAVHQYIYTKGIRSYMVYGILVTIPYENGEVPKVEIIGLY